MGFLHLVITGVWKNALISYFLSFVLYRGKKTTCVDHCWFRFPSFWYGTAWNSLLSIGLSFLFHSSSVCFIFCVFFLDSTLLEIHTAPTAHTDDEGSREGEESSLLCQRLETERKRLKGKGTHQVSLSYESISHPFVSKSLVSGIGLFFCLFFCFVFFRAVPSSWYFSITFGLYN